MRRPASVLAAAWIALGVVPAASPSDTYTSPHGRLTYRYAAWVGADGSEAWRFEVPSKSGDLAMAIEISAEKIVVRTRYGPTGDLETLAYSMPEGAALPEIELAWPSDRMSARLRDHGEPGWLERVAGTLPDCETLVTAALPAARRVLLETVRDDYLRYDAAPKHLEALAAALQAATTAPLVAGECKLPQGPSAGNCYSGTVGFNDCLQCCEMEGNLLGLACQIWMQSFCVLPICHGLGGVACGGMASLTANYCAQYNCRGKPGDPGCNDSLPCEGSCMYFCGPGWGSGCGHCDGQGVFNQECCR